MMGRELPDYYVSIICYLNYITFILEFKKFFALLNNSLNFSQSMLLCFPYNYDIRMSSYTLAEINYNYYHR